MEEKSALLQDMERGKRLWAAPSQTKDALVRFQRDVVLPLRTLAAERGLRLKERAELFRGARFVVQVEVTESDASSDGSSGLP